jgi:N-methylhydantoinase B
MLYSGWDGRGDFFYLMEISYGGIPGRPIGDGMDGHSWWPLFQNIPTEYLEAYYPVRIDGYTTVTDSGGAGFHRGGNGIEKRYVYLEPGEISIHDDRWLTYPWGILGGKPGMRSEKILQRVDGTSERLPSKTDEVKVEPGDVLVYRTAGGGGWKDPLDRPAEQVDADVAKGLVSKEKAEADYGVVVGDAKATEALRVRMREERGDVLDFDFGPSLDEIRERAEEETGLVPPVPPEPLAWAPMESGEDALARVREKGDRQMTLSETE